MDVAAVLADGLREQPSHFITLSEIAHARKQRHRYAELSKTRNWAELAESCQRDVQGVSGNAAVIVNAIRELRSLRAQTARTVRLLQAATVARDRALGPKDRIRSVSDPAAEAVSAAIDRYAFPRNQGRFVFSAADSLLRWQGEALQGFVQAELNRLSHRSHQSEAQKTAVLAFWADPKIGGLSSKIAAFKNALNSRHQSIYVAALTNRAGLGGELRALIGWTSLNLRELVRSQYLIQLLLQDEGSDSDDKTAQKLRELSIEVAVITRELMASHVAALVSLFDINGIGLSLRTSKVLAGAWAAPLHGRLHAGKRSDLKRLQRLPDGFFVRVQGTVSAVEFVRGKDGGYCVATLRSSARSDEVHIVSRVNLLDHGLQPGCEMRASGFYRKKGSPIHAGEHLEVETLKLSEIYSRDIWKVAFLGLAAPYFGNWPADLHLVFSFVPQPRTEDPAPEVSRVGSLCADEYDAYHTAAQLADAADASVVEAHVACGAAAVAMWGFCILTPLTGGAAVAACVAAIAADTAAIAHLNTALVNQAHAQQNLARDHQRWLDCITPKDPLPSTGHSFWPHTGGAGSGGDGSGQSGHGGWSDETPPDWLVNWEEPESPPLDSFEPPSIPSLPSVPSLPDDPPPSSSLYV